VTTSRKRLRAILIGAGALVAAIIAMATAFDGWRLHQQLMAANEREMTNLALALATGTERSVQAVDVLLRDTAAWYEATGRDDSTEAIHDALASRAAGVGQVSVMTIVDRSGMQRYRSRATGEPLSDVSDRRYFQRQRDEPDAGLVINEPVVTRSERVPSLVLSRPLRRPDGTFDGVVSANLTLPELQSMYAAIRLGDHGALLLALADGTIVTRLPPVDPQRLARMPRLVTLAGGPSIHHVMSPMDGRAKLMAVLRVDGRPLILALTRDVRDALSPWYDEMASAGIRTAASTLFVVAVIVGVLYQLGRIERGEQALSESQERYAMAMEAADEGHTEWNLRRGTVFVSGKWRSLHGLDAQRPIGTVADLRGAVRIHAEDSTAVCSAIDRHLDGETDVVDVEYRVQRPDGGWSWVHSRGRCIRDETKTPVRLFFAAHDISARKASEASRIALEQRMQQTRRMEALGTLAGGIAHDFNNLLGAILGFGGMARQLSEDGSPIRRHIERVLQAGSRAKALVRGVLQFARSSPAGGTPVKVQRIVEEVILILSPSLPEGVSVETHLDAPDAEVKADATELYQVVANLYTNAIQAAEPSGRVRLLLAAVGVGGPRPLLHGELAPGRHLRLDIEDSGPGMPPEMISRIFEPFFTTKSPGEGTGLGLSVVHGIVSAMGGAIDVQSAPGVGTRVSVWLPLIAADDTAPAAPPKTPRGRGEVILVVDDEPLLVELAAERLAELGYAPLAFTSSTKALQAFLEAPSSVDLILTDEKMPELSGSRLVGAIRAKRPDIPVIMMSGHVTAALEERARALGVGELLRKPLSDDALTAAVARCLGVG
jgi:PAS domain S-box-containing protein